MDLGELIPITAIIATAIVILSAMRFKRERLRVENGGDTGTGIAGAQENARLAHENETLRLTVRRLEERMAVIERITVEKENSLEREIEQLR
jgi:hypothetical protein